MKCTHHYCDTCGKQMSYIDSDGEVCVQGLVSSGMAVDLYIKTTGGSSTCRVNSPKGEYCSFDCFSNGINSALYLTAKESGKMKALP